MIFRDFVKRRLFAQQQSSKSLKIIADREHEARQTGIAPTTTNHRRFT